MTGLKAFLRINSLAIKNAVKPFCQFLLVFGGLLFISPLLSPIIYREVFTAFEQGNMQSVVSACMVAFVIVLMMFAFSFLLEVYGDAWIVRIMNNGKARVFEKFHKLPFYETNANYEKGAVHAMIDRGIGDNMVVWAKLTVILSKLGALLFAFYMSARVSLLYLLLVLATIGMDIIAFAYEAKKIREYAVDLQSYSGQQVNILNHIISNIENISISGNMAHEQQRYEASRKSFWDTEAKKLHRSLQAGFMSGVVALFAQFTFFFTLSIFVGNQAVTSAAIALSISLFNSARDSATQIREEFAEVKGIFVPSEKLDTLLSSPGYAVATKNMEALIAFANVSLKWNEKMLFDKISFSIKSGDKIAIVGENGSGKTTLLRLMLGLIPPSEGEISRTSDPGHAGQIFGYAPVSPQLFSGSVKHNLASGTHIEDGQAEIRAAKELELMGILDQNIDSLSGGQMQLANIARAIVAGGLLTIADEPTASLDAVKAKMAIQALINNSQTLIIVTHDRNILRHFDVVWEINEGEIRR